MKTLKVDPDTKDLVFANGNFEMVEGPDEEVQAVRMAVSTNKGEWFLDTLHGLAYKYLQGKNPNEVQIKAEVTETLYQEDRVSKVLSVEIDFNRQNRKLTITFSAKMKSGEIVTEEVTV